MKSIIKIKNMKLKNDVGLIQDLIQKSDGIIASQIFFNNKEIILIYNEGLFEMGKFIDNIEDMGYIVN